MSKKPGIKNENNAAEIQSHNGGDGHLDVNGFEMLAAAFSL
jgi:hypothetical protein